MWPVKSSPLPPLSCIWDVMLVWRKADIEKNCLYSLVYYYNGLQRYEQFLQVSRLYRALILLDLALSSECLCVFGLRGAVYIKPCLLASFFLPSSVSSERLCIFGLCGAIYNILNFFCLHPSLYLLVSWAWWHGWLTIVLQCCDTVGWVIWPVKSSPKWPIMFLVGR